MPISYQAVNIVKQAYSVLPVYDKIIDAILKDGVWNLPKTCNLTPGVPIEPMLANAANGVSDIVQKFNDTEYTCEYKYDGVRAQVWPSSSNNNNNSNNFRPTCLGISYLSVYLSVQIHYLDDGSVEIYSRNAERYTGKFPDVVALISRYCLLQCFI